MTASLHREKHGSQRTRVAIWSLAVSVAVVLGAVVVARLLGPNERLANGEIAVASPAAADKSAPRPVSVRSLTDGGNAEGSSGDGNHITSLRTSSSATTLSKTDLDHLTAEYRAAVAELEAEVAAYRASNPIYEGFRKTLDEEISPFLEEGLLSNMALVELGKRAPELVKASNYQRDAQVDKKISEIQAALLGKSYAKVLVEVDEGRIQPSEKEEAILLNYCEGLAQHRDPKADAARYQNPFDENTIEAYQFRANLQYAVIDSARILGMYYKILPPELEEKRRSVERIYSVLREATPPNKANDLPERYMDEYDRWWEKQFDRLREVSDTVRMSFGGTGDAP